MYALTIKQPWAWAIARGLKVIENRDWKPTARAMGQWVAIHAGKSFDRKGWDEFAQIMASIHQPQPDSADFQYGAVIAVARLHEVVAQSDDPWFSGEFGWVLTDIQALPEPVPCRGALGLWQLPAEVESAVRLKMDSCA